MMKTPISRPLVWAYGAAALVTAMLIVGASAWLALGRAPDAEADSASTVAPTGSPRQQAPPSAREQAPSASPSPSTLPEMAKAIEDRRDAGRDAAGEAGLADTHELGEVEASGPPATNKDRAAAHGWLREALDWRVTDIDNGAWDLAAERASEQYAATDAQVVIAASTALERIAHDTLSHAALPRVVAVADKTDPAWDAPDAVTLEAAVVFGTGQGWVRPGLRLLVNFQVEDGKVTGVFIDEAYVASDPELVP